MRIPLLEDYVPGADFSKWSGEIDHQKVADEGVKYAGIRASYRKYGELVEDVRFKENYDGFVDVGVIPLPYYVVYLDEDPDEQAEFYVNVLDGRKTWVDVPDVEVIPPGPIDRTNNGRTLHYTMRAVEQATSAMQMIYTAEGFWEANMPSKFLKPFNDRPLWAASYGWDQPMPYVPAHPNWPTLPDIWDSWICWQFSQRWYFDGVVSQSDADYMKAGFFRALVVRSGIGAGPPPPPDPVPVPPPAPDGWKYIMVKGEVQLVDERV